MPVTKAAIKKQRQDKKRTLRNDKARKDLSVSIKAAKKSKKADSIEKAFSSADKAVKKGIIHKNKAARIKSQLAKLAPISVASKKTTKKASKKTK